MEKVHLSMVLHAPKEARAQKSTLATIWLDIANTYRLSLTHKLIVFALCRYGLSPMHKTG